MYLHLLTCKLLSLNYTLYYFYYEICASKNFDFRLITNVYLYFYWNYIDSLLKLCSLNNTNFSFEEERENT